VTRLQSAGASLSLRRFVAALRENSFVTALVDESKFDDLFAARHHDDDRHDYAVAGCLTSYATKEATR